MSGPGPDASPPPARAVGTPVDALWRLGLRAAYTLMRLYWFAFRPSTRGVYVALWHEGRVLLIQNSYKRHASLPGGGVARREAPGEAALRELREEVGIALAPPDLRHAGDWTTFHDHHEERASVFECRLEREPRVVIDRREVVAARFEAPAQALRGDLAPTVRLYLETRGSGG